MTYEEKLDLILKAIIEAQKATINGQFTKLYIKSENGLENIGRDEVKDILYKLEIEEKILRIIDIYNRLLPIGEQPNNVKYLLINLENNFNDWVDTYLLKQKSNLVNMDFINLIKIHDVMLDIEEQLQIIGTPTVFIPALPQLIKFQILFPVDSIGTRQNYQDNRFEAIKFLHQKGILSEYKYIEDDYYGHGKIKVTVNISNFNAFLKETTNEYIKRNKVNKETEKPKETITETKQEVKMTKVGYDPKKGELNIEGKIVKLNKDSFRTKLIELLLKDEKNRKKEWSWDEAVEKIEGTKDIESTNENKKRFYPACDGLSKFIAQKIGVNDLLIFNKSNVQINPKYL